MGRSNTTMKPGETRNPNGRPKVAPEHRIFKKLTLDKYLKLLKQFVGMNATELKAIVSNPNSTVLEIFVAQIISKGISQGDTNRLSFLLDRLMGPVKQQIEHSGKIETKITKVEVEIRK